MTCQHGLGNCLHKQGSLTTWDVKGAQNPDQYILHTFHSALSLALRESQPTPGVASETKILARQVQLAIQHKGVANTENVTPPSILPFSSLQLADHRFWIVIYSTDGLLQGAFLEGILALEISLQPQPAGRLQPLYILQCTPWTILEHCYHQAGILPSIAFTCATLQEYPACRNGARVCCKADTPPPVLD